MNQSELEANTRSRHQARENASRQLQLVLVLLLIGLESTKLRNYCRHLIENRSISVFQKFVIPSHPISFLLFLFLFLFPFLPFSSVSWHASPSSPFPGRLDHEFSSFLLMIRTADRQRWPITFNTSRRLQTQATSSVSFRRT